MLYANYIRNKMHHLVKSVFASGYPLKIISKFKKKAVNYTIHGKTQIGKNLIPYPYINTTKTTNGVTYTDNGDGSVTISGTATGYSDFFFKIMSIAPNTTFTFSKNQSDDAANVAFTLRQLDENRVLIGTEISLIPTVATHTFTTAENARYIQIACKRYANVECKGTYKPMLELGDTATEYEKYTVYGVGDKTKNLIPYPYANTTKTVNGVTFTDNGDGSITVNGTATASTWFNLSGKTQNKIYIPKGIYTMSGGSSEETSTAFGLEINVYNGDTKVTGFSNKGNRLTVDTTPYTFTNISAYITIYAGATFNNLVLRPMLEIGNTATDYEPYGYKIPFVNRGKNLIPYPYARTAQTINGVTYTDNGDGTVTVSGTATANVNFQCSELSSIPIPQGHYMLSSGVPDDDAKNAVGLAFGYKFGDESRKLLYTIGGQRTITLNETAMCDVIIGVRANQTINNLVFRPMLELGNTATDYEPYRVPDTTNVYHTAPLKDGESISYKADGLPELQLYKGENNITADTAVAPSVIDIKYLN